DGEQPDTGAEYTDRSFRVCRQHQRSVRCPKCHGTDFPGIQRRTTGKTSGSADILNHPNFGDPETNINSPNFGRITTLAGQNTTAVIQGPAVGDRRFTVGAIELLKFGVRPEFSSY